MTIDQPKSDTLTENAFPVPPVEAGPLLRPIVGWAQMHAETKATGVEFGAEWCDYVIAGDTCFFSWLGQPRATVLVLYDHHEVLHAECLKVGDAEMSDEESAPVLEAVREAFERGRLVAAADQTSH